jgi:hypothetical protein
MQDDSEPDDSYGKVVPSPAQEPDDSNEEAEAGPLEKQDDSHEEVEVAAHEQDDSDGEAEVGEEVGVGPAQKPKKKRRGVWIAVAVVVVLIVAGGVGYALYEANQSDDETAAERAEPASGGVVEIPQVPSLKMVEEEGTLYVENDGNVTMSDIEVRDAAGTTVCAMEVISPGDREPCEEAGDAQDLTVFGSGPQGQPVEAGLSEESPDS